MKSLSFVFALLVLLGFGAPAHAQDNPFKDTLNQVVDRVGAWWGRTLKMTTTSGSPSKSSK